MLGKVTLFTLLTALPLLAQGNTTCTKLDSAALINQYAKQHPSASWDPGFVVENLNIETIINFTKSGSAIRWLSIGWEGPIDGILFAANCDGNAIDAKEIGSVEKISAGPTISGLGETVLVNYTDGTGTGAIHKSYSLYMLDGSKLTQLWTHSSFEGDYAVGLQGDDGEETTFHIDKINAETIELSGLRKISITPKGLEPYPERDGDKTHIDRIKETYCWNQAKKTYLTCPESKPLTR
jgi:hypothetical protein